MDELDRFKDIVWRRYHTYGRHDLPWRLPEADGGFGPYKILVSEIMLQQTQVARVVPKYQQFLERFPSFSALSAAPLGDVLRIWSGLGYNRRAKFLRECAKQVAAEHDGALPHTTAELVKLPGIGPNTAGAVVAYAFNEPAVFVETNIRAAFLHHFFAGQQAVSDKEILKLVEKALPGYGPGKTARTRIHVESSAIINPEEVSHYRHWYWALMDYGAHLKQTVGNPNTASRHYAKQSRFAGSKRQIRGQVLRLLGQNSRTLARLQQRIADERLPQILHELTAEGLIAHSSGTYRLGP